MEAASVVISDFGKDIFVNINEERHIAAERTAAIILLCFMYNLHKDLRKDRNPIGLSDLPLYK